MNYPFVNNNTRELSLSTTTTTNTTTTTPLKKKGRKTVINMKEDPDYFKNYYKNNIDKWLKRKEVIILCEVCNKSYRLHKKSVHAKTKTHILCMNAFNMGLEKTRSS